MRSADFSRREHASRDAVAHVLKVLEHTIEAEVDMAGDVFEESPFRAAFVEDAGDMRPEVARVLDAFSMAGIGEGLTGVSRSEDIHSAAPASAVEGGSIVPDRCLT